MPSAPATPATGAHDVPESLDVAGAASLFENILPDEETSDDLESQPSEEGTEDGSDTDEPAEEAEEPGEDEPTEEEDEPADEPQDPEAEVLFEHEGKPVTRGEAKKGYLRQSDYTRKTQAVAELKKQAETEMGGARADRTRFIELSKQYEAALKELVPQEPDWDAIKAKYPDQFPSIHAEWLLHQGRVQKAQQERQEAEKAQAEEAGKARGQAVQQEWEKLSTALPVLKDPVKGKAVMQKAFEYGQQAGFTPDELMGTIDSRALILLYKAMQYDAGKAKAKPAKELAPAAKGTKKTVPLKPGAAAPRKGKSSSSKAEEAIKRSRSGRVQDAAAAIFHMMPD